MASKQAMQPQLELTGVLAYVWLCSNHPLLLSLLPSNRLAGVAGQLTSTEGHGSPSLRIYDTMVALWWAILVHQRYLYLPLPLALQGLHKQTPDHLVASLSTTQEQI